MDRKKVISVIAIFVVFLMVIGAYYGVIPTINSGNTNSAESNISVNKAVVEGIPQEITLTNTSQTSFRLTITGVSGVTTDLFFSVISEPTNVTAYFTTTSTSHWKIENNGTVAEYRGYPLYAGDVIDDLILHIDSSGNPVSGKVVYGIHSNDVLVIKNDVETTINT